MIPAKKTKSSPRYDDPWGMKKKNDPKLDGWMPPGAHNAPAHIADERALAFNPALSAVM